MNKQKFVIVTGATRGLGLGCVEALLRDGHRVLATGRDSTKIRESFRPDLCENLIVENLDVSSLDSLTHFEKRLPLLTDHVDVLINNAGVFLDERSGGGAPLSTSVEDFERTLRTNVMGPYRMCQIVLPLMKNSSEPRIVNVSSGMSQLTAMAAGSPAYRVSKTALNGLTAQLAAELRGTSILVNSVCPGWVKTEMGGVHAQRELAEGVASILWAAQLPAGGPSGGLYRDGKLLEW